MNSTIEVVKNLMIACLAAVLIIMSVVEGLPTLKAIRRSAEVSADVADQQKVLLHDTSSRAKAAVGNFEVATGNLARIIGDPRKPTPGTVAQMSVELNTLLHTTTGVVDSSGREVKATTENVNAVMASLNDAVKNTDTNVQALLHSAQPAVENLNGVVLEAQKTVAGVNSILPDVKATASNMNAASVEVVAVAKNVDGATGELKEGSVEIHRSATLVRQSLEPTHQPFWQNVVKGFLPTAVRTLFTLLIPQNVLVTNQPIQTTPVKP